MLTHPFQGYLLTAGLLLAIPVVAEIKSMSSGEMTETFVKDSTIIVTPAKEQKAPAQPRSVVTYTIAPGEPVKTEAEIQADQDRFLNQQFEFQTETALSNIQVGESFALQPRPDVDLAPLKPRELPFGIEMPAGAFTAQDLLNQTGGATLPYGGELDYRSDGATYTLTIGNLPGFDPVNLDQSYQGQLLELRPRDTGGFDMIFTLPQNGQQ